MDVTERIIQRNACTTLSQDEINTLKSYLFQTMNVGQHYLTKSVLNQL